MMGLEAGTTLFVLYLLASDITRLRMHKKEAGAYAWLISAPVRHQSRWIAGSFISFFATSFANVVSFAFSIVYLLALALRFAYFYYGPRNDFDILTPRVFDLHFMYRMYSCVSRGGCGVGCGSQLPLPALAWTCSPRSF